MGGGQTNTHTNTQTHTHINTMTRPGLGPGRVKICYFRCDDGRHIWSRLSMGLGRSVNELVISDVRMGAMSGPA